MSGSELRFVDTNVLVYAHDRSAGVRHAQAKALVEGLWVARTGVVSTQVLQELYVTLRKKVSPALSPDIARAIVDDYRRWHVVVNDDRAVIEASELEERFLISFWDALIVHSALIAGAPVLYSEDLNSGQDYAGVRVLNPFATE